MRGSGGRVRSIWLRSPSPGAFRWSSRAPFPFVRLPQRAPEVYLFTMDQARDSRSGVEARSLGVLLALTITACTGTETPTDPAQTRAARVPADSLGVSGGSSTGGVPSSGGTINAGGAATGGNATGGTAISGGTSSGGKATGGTATGGTATGGRPTGICPGGTYPAPTLSGTPTRVTHEHGHGTVRRHGVGHSPGECSSSPT